MSASPSELRPNEPFPPFGSLLGSGPNRSGMAIAQLWSSQGKAADATGLLADIYRRFSEGDDTMDQATPVTSWRRSSGTLQVPAQRAEASD